MLDQFKISFFVLCDDDFVFDRRTRLPLMKSLLQENQLDLLEGVFRQHNRKTRKGIYSVHLNEFLIKLGWVLPAAQFYEDQANFEIETNRISLKKVVYNEPLTPQT